MPNVDPRESTRLNTIIALTARAAVACIPPRPILQENRLSLPRLNEHHPNATMTSIASESATTIAVSCKQTRFHIDSPNYREVGILRPK